MKCRKCNKKWTPIEIREEDKNKKKSCIRRIRQSETLKKTKQCSLMKRGTKSKKKQNS